MEEIKQLAEDVKEVKTDVKAIMITLAKNTESLVHHMSRTELNEARIKQVETWLLGFLTSVILSVLYYFVRR